MSKLFCFSGHIYIESAHFGGHTNATFDITNYSLADERANIIVLVPYIYHIGYYKNHLTRVGSTQAVDDKTSIL